MYRPVKPLIVKKSKGYEDRPFTPMMLAARLNSVGVPTDIECEIKDYKEENYLFYWRINEGL